MQTALTYLQSEVHTATSFLREPAIQSRATIIERSYRPSIEGQFLQVALVGVGYDATWNSALSPSKLIAEHSVPMDTAPTGILCLAISFNGCIKGDRCKSERAAYSCSLKGPRSAAWVSQQAVADESLSFL